jgi:pimeloyl-ACP methyl ester carboxylesterase
VIAFEARQVVGRGSCRCDTGEVRTFVLVHAPLVGPSSWRWVGDELRKRGHDVVVPLLREDGEVEGDRLLRALVSRAASAVPVDAEVVLVGHSGGGLLLPLIADHSGTAAVNYVFVDSGLPPAEGGLALADGEFRGFLQERVAVDGRLPAWHTWWGEGAIESMVSDEQRRREVVGEIPRLPLAFFDVQPQVPAGWRSTACGYVLLSEPYRRAADEAAAEGWPLHEVLGSHLELVNRPAAVASAILGAVGVMRAT